MKNLDINEAFKAMSTEVAMKQVQRNNFKDSFNQVIKHESEKVNKLTFYVIENSLRQSAKQKRYNLIVVNDLDIIYNSSNVIDLTASYSIEDLKKQFKTYVNFLNNQINF